RARVLRRWIGDCRLPPLPAEGVARIERDLLQGDADDTPEFGWRDVVVRRWRDLLWAERRRPALDSKFDVVWRGDAPLVLPTGDALSLAGEGVGNEPTHAGWRVHARTGGERITLPGRLHSHALKQVLQDLG